MNNKKHVITFITVAFIGATGFLFCLQTEKNEHKDIVLTSESTEVKQGTEETFIDVQKEQTNQQSSIGETGDVQQEDKQQIVVHICGEVKNPGVYKLENGTRLNGLIKMAGGLTKKAAGDYVNQAQVLTDEAQILIPSLDELEALDKRSEFLANGTEKVGKSTNLIHLNKATVEELMTLPGIGEAKARSIIAYREEHGGFKTIDEIKNIEGIKEGVFRKISDLITL